MKLKIQSDGTTAGTKVISEDGRVVRGVTEVTWTCGPTTFPLGEAVIRLRRVPIEVIGEAGEVFEGEK